MTLIDPIPGTPATVPSLSHFGYVPFPDSQPFSQRTASGYQESLEQIIRHLHRLNDYLKRTNPQGTWDANVLALIAAVESALEAQTADNAQRIADATEALLNSSIHITDPAVLLVLQKLDSGSREYLDTLYADKVKFGELSAAFAGVKRFYAPDPNGTDDTAVLNALFQAMMKSEGIGSGPGEVILGPGTYKGNWILDAGFWSGKIKGRGKQATYLQSLDEFHAVLRVNGASGSITSGSLSDLTIAGTNLSSPTARKGVGTELNGIGGFQIERVQYTNLDQAHRWMIDTAGEFTEFCVLRDVNMNYCRQPLTYAGAGSYHGSGIEGNSIIGLGQGESLMEIGPGCNVYNAPLSLTVFTNEVGAGTTTTGNVIVNRYERPCSFYGHFRMEMQGGRYWLGWTGGSYIYYCGTIDMWGGPCRLGRFFLVDKVTFTGTSVVPFLKPWNVNIPLGLGTTAIMGGAPINGPGFYEASIEVFGPNGYWVSVMYRIWSSGTSVPPFIERVSTHVNNTPGAAGGPIFAWDNGLTIRGDGNGYDGNYLVSATYRVLLHANATDNLSQ